MAINNGIGRVWAANAGDEGRPAGVGPVWIENIDAITPSGSGGSTYTGGNGIDVDNNNHTISLDDEAQAAIDSYVNNSGSFLTDEDLNGYATETWVSSQGYLTSIPSEYVTDTEMSEYVTEETSAFVTSADIPEVPTIKDLIAGNGINITTTSSDVTISADTSVLATQADLGPYATQTWTAQNYFPIDGLQVVGSSAEASGANIIYIVSGSNA